MSEKSKERLLDLLADKTIFGLDDAETAELAELEAMFPELKNDGSMEATAAAFGLTNLDISEPMPATLKAKVLTDANVFFAPKIQEPIVPETPVPNIEPVPSPSTEEPELQKAFEFDEPKRSSWNWLGWALAGFAIIALATNIYLTRFYEPQIANIGTESLNAAQMRQRLVDSSPDVIKTEWAEPDAAKAIGIKGDVVWSNSKQVGYLRFTGLPKNDKTKETYQLWIFDANQDDKAPIDGGIFDVSADGEVIIPINAKIEVTKPTMFAVTAEKPGGVVVSKREKLLTIAKVAA